MQKCRYSVDGNCTNENVACEKCNSTEYEMRACTPFQRCIALHNDNWAVEVEEDKDENDVERKRNNSSWCCDQIEEKIIKWKQEIADSENTNHYEDSDMEFGRMQGMREIISEIEEIFYF